jgi:hypothetical protein
VPRDVPNAAELRLVTRRLIPVSELERWLNDNAARTLAA